MKKADSSRIPQEFNSELRKLPTKYSTELGAPNPAVCITASACIAVIQTAGMAAPSSVEYFDGSLRNW